VISSMVLGLRDETPEELEDLFSRTGTLHLFAISGLHVGLLCVIAIQVLRPLGLGRRILPFAVLVSSSSTPSSLGSPPACSAPRSWLRWCCWPR